LLLRIASVLETPDPAGARHPGQTPDPAGARDPAGAPDPGEAPDPADEDGTIGRSLLAWAAAFDTLEGLRAALHRARGRRDTPEGMVPLTLATAHGTKGLEFDHVAVVGMDEGTFPSGRSVDEAPDRARALDEERRLAYVAWTRARRELVLVHDPYAPSMFLREAFDPWELEFA